MKPSGKAVPAPFPSKVVEQAYGFIFENETTPFGPPELIEAYMRDLVEHSMPAEQALLRELFKIT